MMVWLTSLWKSKSMGKQAWPSALIQRNRRFAPGSISSADSHLKSSAMHRWIRQELSLKMIAKLLKFVVFRENKRTSAENSDRTH